MNKEIIETIKIFNIGSTAKKYNRLNINYNNELNINYDENISIGNIFNIFINEYLKFKEEYDKLSKLNCYEDLNFISFSEYENSKMVSLDFFDDDNTMKSRYGYLILSLEENDGIYSSYVFNDLIGKEFNQREENINPEIVKQYIELFQKYKNLFDAYNFFKKKGVIFGNGYSALHINIQGEILEDLNTFEIFLGNDLQNRELVVELKVDISDKNEFIDKKVRLLNKEIEPTSEIINYIFKNTYLNKEYLPEIYRNNQKEFNDTKEDIEKQLKLTKNMIK